MSTLTRLTPDELDDVAAVIADWIGRGTTPKSRRDRLMRYHHGAVNPRALGEILHEAQPEWPDERTARAAQCGAGSSGCCCPPR
jgi:hypothetical protein